MVFVWALAHGEASASAAVRELREETGLRGRAVRELYPGCWLVEVPAHSVVQIGTDPEVTPDRQRLRGVAWFSFEEKADDHQVARVRDALSSADTV